VPLGYAHAMTFTAGVLITGALSAFALIFPERTLARFAKTANEPASPSAAAAVST